VPSLHHAGALTALAASGLLVAFAAVAAWRDVAHGWVQRMGLVLTGVYAAVAALGLLLLATGESPHDGLHLLYGLVLVAAVPIGMVFASEAPPQARSGVLAVAGVAALLVIWRLFSTG
jgi:hypothetical protein